MSSSVPYTFASQTGPIPLNQLDINFANVKGYADTAGTVTANAQGNITSVGTLTGLTVSGAVSTGALTATTITGQLSVGTQANITQVGTQGTLDVTGNIDAGNVNAVRGEFTVVSGTLTDAAQPTITSVGNLVSLIVVGNTSSGNISSPGIINGQIITANGNINANNAVISNNFSASGNATIGGYAAVTGNITGANLGVSGSISGSTLTLSGSATISGNLTVSGTTTTVNSQTVNIADKNITIANNVSTSSLIDGAGIDAGNPVVSYIRYTDASKGWVTANNFSVGGNLSVTGTTTLTGNVTAPTVANSVSNTQIATTAFVRNIFPTGIISLWYGDLASIPDGWYLCDGSNGTPNLTDLFVVGAGSAYDPGDTGGVDSVTPSGNVLTTLGSTALTEAQMPKHYHQMRGPNSISAPQNDQGTGSFGSYGGGTPDDPAQQYGTYSVGGNASSGGTSTGTSNGDPHTHSLTASFVGFSQENRPAYYALAYIMKA